MFRPVTALAVASLALFAAAPVLAADYSDGLRGSFTADNYDGTDLGDTLNFELGLRYFYSKGHQSFEAAGSTVSADDTSHILEGHLKIDDSYTRTYVKGLIGYSMAISGDGTSPSYTGPILKGHVGYAGGDFGWQPFGDDAGNLRFGFLGGYQYWNDSPSVGRANFTTGTGLTDFVYDGASGRYVGPGNSVEDDITVNALRLGVTANARLGPMVDLSAELAAVPYAKVGGTLGSYGFYNDDGSRTTIQSSPAEIDGWGYGAMAEAMVGFHPIENMALRLGGRAWYLQGWTDTTFDTVSFNDNPVNGANPTSGWATQHLITTGNPFSLFRYGALAELTYDF